MNSVASIVSPASIKQIAQFITLLERGGVGSSEIQKVIDDVSLRNQLVRLILGIDELPLVDISGDFNQEGVERYLSHVFRVQILNHDRWMSKGTALTEEGVVPQSLMTTEVMKDLMEGLDPFHVAVIVLRNGLLDGEERRAKQVGEMLGVTTHQVGRALASVRRHIEARQSRKYAFVRPVKPEDGMDGTPLSELNLPVNLRNLLLRQNIRTVQQLVDMSVPDLLDLPKVGSKWISDIETALRTIGLALKSS